MAEPLAGITVVEMTVAVQGPAAGLYLRDMGAEVIKVEPPIGDPSRYGRGRFNDTPPGTPGPQFVAVNRGKRSVCIDMATEAGSRVLFALLADADVFLTNYREPALQKMGLGYEALRERFPQLVYASVNGFGPKGKDSEKAMFATRTAAEWDDFLRTLAEVIWERVRSWHEVLEDPQNIANDYLTTVDIPNIGTRKTVGTLVKLSETPGSPKGNPPLLGEGNDDVLARLGFSEAERSRIESDATRVREELLAQLLPAASR